MREYFSLELNKIKKNNRIAILTAVITQLVFLYFFTFVSRFDSSSTDAILKNYAGITGLATTITMCIFVVYGTVVANNLIVTNYIGDSRMRLYLYPCGRGQLYFIKNITFIVSFSLMQLLGIVLANIIYVFGESTFTILNSPSPVLAYLLSFAISSIIATLLTASIVLFSSIIGISFSSSIATIITGIISIVFLGNFVAMSFAEHQYITFVATLLLFVLVFIGIIATKSWINKDDVF